MRGTSEERYCDSRADGYEKAARHHIGGKNDTKLVKIFGFVFFFVTDAQNKSHCIGMLRPMNHERNGKNALLIPNMDIGQP